MVDLKKEASPIEEPLHRATVRACVVQGSLSRHELISSKQWPIRYQHRTINTVRDLKETLRAGEFTSYGLYPLYFITADNEPLSFKSVKENFYSIIDAMSNEHGAPTWRVVATEINYEDPLLFCSHSSERIPSAYADDEKEDFIRAGGDVVCTTCQLLYKQHPYSYAPADLYQGHPYLNVLCDGTKVKL